MNLFCFVNLNFYLREVIKALLIHLDKDTSLKSLEKIIY